MSDDPHRIERTTDRHRVVRKVQEPAAEPAALMSVMGGSALLPRVKARVETDLSDTELQAIIDEASADIIAKYGPSATAGAITQWYRGYRHKIVVERIIDTTKTITVTEYITEGGWTETPYTLTSADYRVWPNGLVVERLTTGMWSRWQWPSRVKLTYTPMNDDNQRNEVIIKMAILATQYDSNTSLTVGDVQATTTDYITERNRLMRTLEPRAGMFML